MEVLNANWHVKLTKLGFDFLEPENMRDDLTLSEKNVLAEAPIYKSVWITIAHVSTKCNSEPDRLADCLIACLLG
jgi:hypothetical protein